MKIIFLSLSLFLVSYPFFEVRGEEGDKPTKVVLAEDINLKSLNESLDLMMGWIFNNSHENGRIEYKYWPEKDKYSLSNNMIRQFMTSTAIGELYNYKSDPEILKLWERNLAYNFSKFYLEEAENAYIIYNKKSKLGANAVASMNLISVDGYNLAEPYKIAFSKLINAITNSVLEDYSFKTFFGPTVRNNNQAFYPGEALVALSYAEERGKLVLDYKLIKKIKYYYMNWWHKNDRELAFIPWHTQAYYRFYKKSKEEHYIDAIFEMNDFLVSCQARLKDTNSMPEKVGRYYKEGCKKYGPPHSSSTAVYTEGLSYAYKLAKEKNDLEREEKYREAIILGLRSILQLQINKEESEQYKKPNLVWGGVREKFTDDEIRVDNVQHSIMAILAVIKFKVLEK